MADHAQMLREQGLSVPTPNPNPTIMIQKEPKLQPARSAIFSDGCADCRPGFPHPARDGSGAPLQGTRLAIRVHRGRR
jgi:hypothetical protein